MTTQANQAFTYDQTWTPTSTPANSAMKAGASSSTIASPTNTPDPMSKIQPDLLNAMNTNSGNIDFSVILTAQAVFTQDTTSMSRAEASAYVSGVEQEVANRTQPTVRSILDGLKNQGSVQGYQPLWIVNAFRVSGSAQAIKALAQSNDVWAIELNHNFITDPGEDAAPSGSSTPTPTFTITPTPQLNDHAGKQSPNATPTIIRWNINVSNVPTVWAEGYTGSGVTIGIVDTGVDYNHPALKAAYRGYNYGTPTQDYNWHVVPYNASTPTPGFDLTPPKDFNIHGLGGHGSFVAGVALGFDTTDHIGVAPGANWIACGMQQITATPGTDQDNEGQAYLCLQWMQMPTNTQGTPDASKAPAVVNLSSGGTDESLMLRMVVHSLLKANIVPVIAAGNNGPTPGTITQPGKYRDSFAVGAVGYPNSAGTPGLTYYSGRGPAVTIVAPTTQPGTPTMVEPTVDTNLVKPEVLAPGGSGNGTPTLDIYSSIGNGGYALDNGTSFSAPHVAGLVALLLNASSGLSAGDIEFYITHGVYATPGVQPDNNYGWGLINAAKSIDLVRNACIPGHYSFSDVPPGYQYEDEIAMMVCGGVMSGYPPAQCVGPGTPTPTQGCFLVGNPVSRGDMARMISLTFGVAQYTPTSPTYPDVPSKDPNYVYIESVTHAHIMEALPPLLCNTNPPLCFGPSIDVTRAQAAEYIERARNYAITTPTPLPSPTPSQDFHDVPPTYSKYDSDYNSIETLFELGVVDGYYYNYEYFFYPDTNIRRDELARFLRYGVYVATGQ